MKDVSTEPLPNLLPRERDGHKRNYGRVLLVGGSRGMAGAVSLSGMAALRSGAGLVTVATPRCIQATVAGFSPAYMTVGLPDDGDQFDSMALDPLLEWIAKVDVVAIGPGMGRSPKVAALVKELYMEVPTLMVVDADGLNAVAESPAVLASPGGPRVLTPHPGEYTRLTGDSVGVRPSTRSKAAAQLAQRDTSGQTVVILKGAGTVVADNKKYAFNLTGNPGMATGGTGDVLTGIVAALAAQGFDLWSAARLAAHVHGTAGDLAAQKLGELSLVATDLVDFLPAAFRQV